MTGTPDNPPALDYPVNAPEGVAPIIFRSQILQAMELQYFNHMRSSPECFTWAEAREAALSTWDRAWSSDPSPRTLEQAIQECRDDLEYWYEE